jgi:tetratricopeptide (TPR) repeat protein
LQDAIRATDDQQAITDLKVLGSVIQGMSDFGEALVLQERGLYRKAAGYMEQAENEFKLSTQPGFQAFGKWAGAFYHYFGAIASEFDAKYDMAVKEYRKASQAFSEAADTFPSDTSTISAVGSRVRFYADAASDRLESAKTRPEWKEMELQKGKRIAGLVFFILWLVGVAAIVVAVKTLVLSIDALMFVFLLLLTITSASLAAALIKPKEAFDFLSKLIEALNPFRRG